MTEQRAWDDSRVETVLGGLLRTGVILSAAIVLAGGIVYVLRHGSALPEYHGFHGEPQALRTVPGIISGVRDFSGRAMIQLGLLLLIATPVARVAFSVYAFARERDRLYVVITLIVLGLLLFSLFGPHT